MAENLFQGLPPLSSSSSSSSSTTTTTTQFQSSSSLDHDRHLQIPRTSITNIKTDPSNAPAPALKSALKRVKPLASASAAPESQPIEAAPAKRLRFKTSVDATETQVIEAMQKIASHIKNPSKFNRASKLALQLIQAGSVKPGTSDQFFTILEAAMASPSACTEPTLRADYQALFLAAQDLKECFSKQQINQLATWTIRAVVANDLYTDDSFVYAKAAGKIKEAISSLRSATEDDDKDEAAALAECETEAVNSSHNCTSSATSPTSDQQLSDPFGLDALLPSMPKKDEKLREKVVALSNQKAEEETKRFYKSQREALLQCLEIAARRYKIRWAQTVIDLLVKHAFDHKDRFTARQRDAVEKLWASVKEQEIRRKQGKSVTGKLDMNAFEWLQEKYASEKISIRHSVGGGGERRAEQWLG